MTTWRLALHARNYSNRPLNQTEIAGIYHARGRRLERTLNKSASFTFTVDGRSDVAKLITEMETDVVVWRDSIMYGRFIVAQSEDQITADSHTTTFTCHDYFAMLDRRYTSKVMTYAQQPQGLIVHDLFARATIFLTTADQTKNFLPGSYLPVGVFPMNADGSGASGWGTPRDRTYTAHSSIGKLITDLSAVIGGFDFDILPLDGEDRLRVFNDGQGVDNPAAVLEYGGNVAALTRSVNSADFANDVRTIGQATGGADVPPPTAEAWNDDANDVGLTPVGVWQEMDNAADVTVADTLSEQAAGRLDASGVLVPSYSVALRPGTYTEGWLRMGDTVPLVIRTGRLDVVSSVRVVGLAFDISEDGPETVTLTVGRPPTSLVDLMSAGAADVDALARR